MLPIVKAGLIGGLAMAIIHAVVGSLLTPIYFSDAWVNIARWGSDVSGPTSLKRLGAVIVFNIVLGILLTSVYALTYSALPGSNVLKGLVFGLIVFFLVWVVQCASIHIFTVDWLPLIVTLAESIRWFTMLVGLGLVVGLIYKPA